MTWDSFDVLLGLSLFAVVYVAGMTSVSGGIVAGVLAAGGILSYAGSQRGSLDVAWYQLLTGVVLIFTVIKNPEGIVGRIQEAVERRQEPHAPVIVDTVPKTGAAPVRVSRPAPAAGVTLSVRDLTVRYRGLVAVDEVSFGVLQGTIVGLIGPNCAGKTAAIDAISGFCGCTGSVQLDGASLNGLAPYCRIRSGLGRTFQASSCGRS